MFGGKEGQGQGRDKDWRGARGHCAHRDDLFQRWGVCDTGQYDSERSPQTSRVGIAQELVDVQTFRSLPRLVESEPGGDSCPLCKFQTLL